MSAATDNPSRRLAASASQYLRRHERSPVHWHEWGSAAHTRARRENKPILLCIGYFGSSGCDRVRTELFDNPSIAALLNKVCVSILLDRDEHPHLDEIFMAARQLLTQGGGWPNLVFLTPGLLPFYASGPLSATDDGTQTSMRAVLEWVEHVWRERREEVEQAAGRIRADMEPILVKTPGQHTATLEDHCAQMFAGLSDNYDARAGGFFSAPKFPREPYLDFLGAYYAASSTPAALDMITHTLSRMAAGGMYDQVGCGFHRYAIDADWMIPHFEKTLSAQAQLARAYMQGVQLTGNPFFADVANGILQYVCGPLTSGNGGFYSAAAAFSQAGDAAHYLWTPEELRRHLSEDELALLTSCYALADMPQSPGRPAPAGQVLLLRRPLHLAARDMGVPYAQLSALTGQLMNHLLGLRNSRPAPLLDDKIITSANGLMVEALAIGSQLFDKPLYLERARAAAYFILEHAVDNHGRLCHQYAAGKPQHPALLEDVAGMLRGTLALHRATGEAIWLEAARGLADVAREDFLSESGLYRLCQLSESLPIQPCHVDDFLAPSANAQMLDALRELHQVTGEGAYLDAAKALLKASLSCTALSPEQAGLLAAALRLEKNISLDDIPARDADMAVALAARLEGEVVVITVAVLPGWHIHSSDAASPNPPTQLEVIGYGVKQLSVEYPPSETMKYEGRFEIRARISLPQTEENPALRVRLRYQPCLGPLAFAPREILAMP